MHGTTLRSLVPDTLAGLRITDGPEGLSAIHASDCAAVLWQRRPLSGFQAWLDGLAPDQLPRARVILRPDAVRTAVTEACVAAGTPDCADRARLVDDVTALADIFARVMRAHHLRLRLDLVTTNACRKFHVDAVMARMVCTYRGTGTQYGTGQDGQDPRHILTAPTGAPLVLRGTRWPTHPATGLLHRSPPIDGTGETRLLLVLDPISDPDEEI